MSVYIEMMKQSFKQGYIYRANAYISILRNFIYLFVTVSIWTTLYSNKANVDGITLPEVITYVIISSIVSNLISSYMSDIIADRVNNGSIVTDFAKPVSFIFKMFSQQVGSNIYRTVFNTLPVCFIAVIFYGFKFNNNVAYTLLFIFTLLLGIILSFQIDYVLGLLSFWLKSGLYVEFVKGA